MRNLAAGELDDFADGRLDPSRFRHRDHVRIAFALVNRFPFAEAAYRLSNGLKAMTSSAGNPRAYNETMSLAFLSIIAERVIRTGQRDFEVFCHDNPDLDDKNLLLNWYRPELLSSDLARGTFILPEPRHQA